MSSHGEARELYERALRTAPPALDDLTRASILEEFARSAAATDDNQAANDAFEAARAAWLTADRPLEAAAVVAPLVAVRHLLGDGLEARAARLREALSEVDGARLSRRPPPDDAVDRVRAQLLAGLGAAYMLDRRLDESIAYATEARGLAEAAGDGPTERNAAVTLGACLVFAGRMDEGWRLLETAIDETKASELEGEAARAYRMLGTSASVLVEYPRAEHWLREGIVFAERVELWNHRHYMAAHLAHVLWATGRWREAEVVANAALADGRGGMTTRIIALHALGYVALGRGDWARAREALSTARELGSRMAELQRLSPALWGLAELERLTGNERAALQLLDEAAAASAAVSDAAYLFPFVVTGTRLHLAAGDPGAAAAWVAESGAMLTSRGIPGTLPAVDHARGLLHLAEGTTGLARAELEAALGRWSELGRTWEGSFARVDLARCHLRANRRDEAARQARQAMVEATRLGMPALETAAREVLDEAIRRGGEAEPPPWAPLTAREFEVARLVTEGLTNAEVAGELGLSPKTVSAHLEHIMAKLGVGRRAEVAAWVASTGVLDSRSHGDDREE